MSTVTIAMRNENNAVVRIKTVKKENEFCFISITSFLLLPHCDTIKQRGEIMREILAKYAQNIEDKQLLERIFDLAQRVNTRGVYAFSDFLTPAQQALITKASELIRLCEITFDGGYEGALRKVAVLKPKDCCYEQEPPIEILAVKCGWGTPSNRDLLGAIMALGIKRTVLGDIADSAAPPFVVCHSKIAQYLIDELKSAGRCSVKLERGEVGTLPEISFESVTATVASMRLDAVVAEAFSVSRTFAVSLIKGEKVSLNYLVESSVSCVVKEGDVISARGFGKAEIAKSGGQSRKGRTFIEIKRLK